MTKRHFLPFGAAKTSASVTIPQTKLLGGLLSALLMMACSVSNEVVLQIDSNPKGAKILKEGKLVGDAPIVVTHQLTEEDKNRGNFMLMPLSARWLSGAEFHSRGMLISIADGEFQILQFQRPLDAPGEVVDVNYGIELQKLGAMNAQAEYARRQGYAEAMRGVLSQ